MPFERPKQYGDRQFLTEAEHQKAVDALMKQDEQPGRDSRESQGKDIRGTEKDVARAYNEHWFGDKPTQVSYRTSQIIDPPDGGCQRIRPRRRRASISKGVSRSASARHLRRKPGRSRRSATSRRRTTISTA